MKRIALLLALGAFACDGGRDTLESDTDDDTEDDSDDDTDSETDTDDGEDHEGPTIDHRPVADGQTAGREVRVGATITDPSGVASARCRYQVRGDEAWTDLPLAEGDPDDWSARIPASRVRGPTMLYVIEATDALGNSTCIPQQCTDAPLAFTVDAPVEAEEVGVCTPASEDPYAIASARMRGDNLSARVTYQGTGAPHEWQLCWDGTFGAGSPVRVGLMLGHDERGDTPAEELETELVFDLTSIREAYVAAYPSGPGTIDLILEGTTVHWEL